MQNSFMQDVYKIQSYAEAFLVSSATWKKCAWYVLQPFTYTLRPFFKNRLKMTNWEWVNILAQVSFDGLLVFLLGWKVFGFLLMSTLFGMSIHPFAAHYIAEHYVVHKQQETYSYQGHLMKNFEIR